MSRCLTRRSLLAASSTALFVPFAGCSRFSPRQTSRLKYNLESLEVVNAHDQPHEVLIVVTANGSAQFAQSVQLPAADHGADEINSTNRWWDQPVDGPAHFGIHVKVDEFSPRTHRYASNTDQARPSVNAVLWLNRTDGQLYFDTID